MDAIHSKEETTRLRTQIGDLRGKLNDLENKVSAISLWVKSWLLYACQYAHLILTAYDIPKSYRRCQQ